MKLPLITERDYTHKTVFLRLGYDVPVEHGMIQDISRITETLPTLMHLLEQGATLLLVTHMGRPKGTVMAEYSLEPIKKFLEEELEREIVFERKFEKNAIQASLDEAKAKGNIVLLENCRFHPGEEHCDGSFEALFEGIVDAYVNEAFSVSHRAHASIVKVPAIVDGHVAVGFHFHNEVQALHQLLEKGEHPFVVMLGGAKADTKVPLIRSLEKKADVFLLGGAMANTFLAAEGYEVGDSLFEPELRDIAQNILLELESKKEKVILPEDVIASDDFQSENELVSLPLEAITPHMKIGDVGPKTVSHFIEVLSTAKTVIWNGPLGLVEKPGFRTSSKRIIPMLRQVAKHAKVIIGGGDTVHALHLTHEDLEGFSHVSTSGGAFLEFIEKGTLPGIDALI